MQKYAKKFAYIKNLLYLCTEIKKQTNQRWRQHHKIGNKIMKTTKTIERLIENELNITNDQYIVINNVAIKGEATATSQHLVLIKISGKQEYHLMQHWGDGSYRIIGCLWNRDEAYAELKARIIASL